MALLRNLAIAMLVAWGACPAATLTAADVQKFCRFEHNGKPTYGLLTTDDKYVMPIMGDLYGEWRAARERYPIESVKLLPPTEPTQVLALAGNYRSHLKDAEIPPVFRIPQPFYKSPSCLVGQGEAIVLPKDASVVHYEAELVIVIGKTCRKVSKEDAMNYVFGVTCGNDVSERIWQNDPETKDIQWWRAKGADTFGPVGPYIARGLDYGNLQLSLRLNGETRQSERTNLLIHDIPTTVSYISNYVTLHPGDLIFTGTPGKTDTIKAGDVVEVELEGVGILKNPVVAEE